MHSPGFSFGTNDVARRYLNKLMTETGRKYEVQLPKPPNPSQSPFTSTDREQYLRLRGEILARDRILSKLQSNFQPTSPFPQPQSGVFQPISGHSQRFSPPNVMNKSDILHSIRDLSDSPVGGKRLSPISAGIGLPLVKNSPFTRQNPKIFDRNPLTGEGKNSKNLGNSPIKAIKPFGLIDF